jgi:AICAR transformylase/IMP cyclohydrolase PurH
MTIDHPTIDFGETANVSMNWSGVMPQHYGAGGVTVYITYVMDTATTNTVDWDVQFEKPTILTTDAFAAPQVVDNTTVPGAANTLDTVSIAFTDGAQMASVGAGDFFRIKCWRDAANDDATGLAKLRVIEIRET